jgi:hypothetical protein
MFDEGNVVIRVGGDVVHGGGLEDGMAATRWTKRA